MPDKVTASPNLPTPVRLGSEQATIQFLTSLIQSLTRILQQDATTINALIDVPAFDPTSLQTQIDGLDTRLDTAESDINNLESADTAFDARIDKLELMQLGRVYLNTNQTGISNGSFVKINFDTEDFDPSNIWDNTNKQWKPTVAGYYRVGYAAQAQFVAPATQFILSLFKNSSRYSDAVFTLSLDEDGTLYGAGGSDLVYFNGTTDVVDVQINISAGASRDVLANSYRTYFNIELVKAD